MSSRFSLNLICQSFLAIIYIALVLFVLSKVNSSDALWALGASSLSSSCCLVFGLPQGATSQAKNLIGGYIIGIIVGFIIHLTLIDLMPLLNMHQHLHSFWVLASIAVGITIIVMVVTDTIHPPAVGIALIVVLDMQNYAMIWIILVAAFILALMHYVLRPYLKNLDRSC